MNTYRFTSRKFTGYITFVYDDHGLLQRYDTTQAQLTASQANWLVDNLPKRLAAMKALVAQNPDMKLSEPLPTNVTFEQFWPHAYVNKGSSKKVSLKIWNALDQEDRDKAYIYWAVYIGQKPPGEGIKYVETYLRSEIWNN
ncbi:MAG TPA: hypothetical protein PKE30_16770 [Niabella sp.]|nr:hypothetical protein [Niabella sp.]